MIFAGASSLPAVASIIVGVTGTLGAVIAAVMAARAQREVARPAKEGSFRADVEAWRAGWAQENADLKADCDACKSQLEQQAAENDALRQRVELLERQVIRLGAEPA